MKVSTHPIDQKLARAKTEVSFARSAKRHVQGADKFHQHVVKAYHKASRKFAKDFIDSELDELGY